ncbi:MAG: Gldg family protein [Synergistaceae bacterium]|jgi:ABC-type transport system involved in multi-copper enzyme maturation permease subunit|nr:Gldg family protein [Synergistaceae bacterium]
MIGTFRKELRLYFSTVSGYSYSAVFAAISGAFFIMANLMPADGDIKAFFSSFYPSVNFMIPILTMKLCSEERRIRTDELLKTSPARLSGVVAGKFFAALSVFAGCFAVTAAFPLILAACGSVLAVEAAGGYAGMILLASSLIAVGIFISACSENQIVSAVLTYAVFFALHVMNGAGSAMGGALGEILARLSPTGRFIRFANGIFDPSDAVFYISVTVFFLYLSAKRMERDRVPPERARNVRAVLALSAMLFALINICSSLAVRRFDLSADMTGNRLYEVSPAAVRYAGSIASPVTVTVVSDEGSFPEMLGEMLRRIAGTSRRIAVRYADPYENPLLVDRYRQLGYSPMVSDVLVEGENGVRLVKYGDIFVRRDGEIHGIQLEQQLVSAMLAVSSGTGDRRRAAFTSGHGERSSAALRDMISSNGFELDDVYVGAGISKDADVLVIAGPSRDFTPEEAGEVGAYLSGGGKVMAFTGPSERPFTNLGALFAEWGAELMDGVVTEKRAYAAGSPTNVIPRYAPHDINLYFAENPYYVVMPASRGIVTDGEKTGFYGTRPLLLSTSGSVVTGPGGDESGPFTLASISELRGEGGESSALFVAGSAGMYSDDIMDTPSYANGGFLTRTLEYMTRGAASVVIPPKTVVPPRIAVTRNVTAVTAFVYLLALPLVILTAGTLVRASRMRR